MALNTSVSPEHEHQRDQDAKQKRRITLTSVLDQLAQFDGPPDQFLAAMLQVQCKIAPAEAGAILRLIGDERVDLLGAYPLIESQATAPVWLANAAEMAPRVVEGEETTVIPLRSTEEMYAEGANRHLVLVPITSANITAVATFVVATNNPAVLTRAKERLEMTISLLNLYEMRQALVKRNVDLDRLRESMEVLACINEHSRMKAAVMALCNEIASRWKGQRVSIGFLKGRYVKLTAMSHTEKFTRKMKLVQDIESTMEECLDQDTEIVYPPHQDVANVSRAAGKLSDAHGPSTILSLPLRRDGKVIGVITIERAVEDRFTIDEAETLRLMSDLLTARLSELHEHDKWIGAKAAGAVRKTASFAVGSEHTWIKLLILAIVGFLGFAIFVKGPDTVSANFTVFPRQRQVISSPYAGYLAEVRVEKGDDVTKGQVLVVLDTAELQGQLATAKADKATFEREADQARRDGKKGEELIALAKMDKAVAQINLLRYRISQSEIKATIDGKVIAGDWKRQLRSYVEPKTPLFEIAPLKDVYAELSVPENRIADVQPDAFGELSSRARAGTYIPFEVERINAVAEVNEQLNVFKVRAKIFSSASIREVDGVAWLEPLLETSADWIADGEEKLWHKTLQPGMEGVAKIEAGRAPYGYLWTRDLVNWVRMKLWF